MRPALAALLVLAAAAGASTPTGNSIPFGAHGDAVNSTSGQPTALTPTTLLVMAEGPDGTAGTSDDETLFVTGIGSGPAVTAIPTDHVALNAARIERLSATRAALVSSGANGTFGNSDDVLFIVDRLGSGNVVTPVVIGGLGDNQQFTPERLTPDQVVIPSLGPDNLADTSDDEVVVVSLGGASPAALHLPAPYQRAGGRTRMIALSPTAFLIASDGPDKKASGADDLVYLFKYDGINWARTDLAAPGLNRRAAGRPVRVSATLGLAVSAGTDFVDSTADDEVFLIDAAAGTITAIAVPFVKNSSGGQATGLSPAVAAVGTMGADGVAGSADDAVAILSDLGNANTVTNILVGATADNNECRPARLDDTAFALATLGSDRTISTADDEITVVHGVGGTPVVEHVVIGSVAAGTASTLVPLSSSALLLSGGGPDHAVGTSDDEVVVLTGIGSALAVSGVPLGGSLDSQDAFRYVPTVLGGGRAALLSSGADQVLGTGGDDAVRVVGGLDLGSSLSVRNLMVRYARQKLGGKLHPSRVSVKAVLTLEGVDGLLRDDLTVSVGNAAQTLPAGSLVPIRNGRSLGYSDPAGALGIVRSLEIEIATGRLRMEVRGADQAIATTVPGYVPVGFEIGEDIVPESLAARPGPNGFSYHRPKGK